MGPSLVIPTAVLLLEGFRPRHLLQVSFPAEQQKAWTPFFSPPVVVPQSRATRSPQALSLFIARKNRPASPDLESHHYYWVLKCPGPRVGPDSVYYSIHSPRHLRPAVTIRWTLDDVPNAQAVFIFISPLLFHQQCCCVLVICWIYVYVGPFHGPAPFSDDWTRTHSLASR